MWPRSNHKISGKQKVVGVESQEHCGNQFGRGIELPAKTVEPKDMSHIHDSCDKRSDFWCHHYHACRLKTTGNMETKMSPIVNLQLGLQNARKCSTATWGPEGLGALRHIIIRFHTLKKMTKQQDVHAGGKLCSMLRAPWN